MFPASSLRSQRPLRFIFFCVLHMIGLLNAGFLVGITAVAVPIIIHLVHRRRSRPIDFPTLRFLKEVDKRVSRRRRIEELILLALRCAAIAFLALGLAKPLLRPTETAGSGASTTAVIVLDDSFSMHAIEGGVERFERARSAARETLNALRPGDAAALVLPNGSTVGPLTDLGAVRAALDHAKPSWGSAKLSFDAPAKLLEAATTPARELFVVGDLQRGSWSDGGIRGAFETYVVPVAQGVPENATLAGLDLLRRTGASARVRAVVVNRGERTQDRTLTFELDGRAVREERVTLAAHARSGVATDIDLGGAGWHAIKARLDPDALPADDEAFLTIDARAGQSALLIGGGSDGYMDEAFFLVHALDPEGRGVSKNCTRDEAADVPLTDYSFVAVFGDPPPAVMDFVAKGGRALILEAGEAVDHGAVEALSLKDVDEHHPVFRPLTQGESRVDFGSARFYRTTKPAIEKGDAVAARYSDGTPAVLERPHGRGLLLFFAGGVTPAWGNFPLKVGFVPFVHSVEAYLGDAGSRDRFLVGSVLALSCTGGAPSSVRLDAVEKPVLNGAVSFDPFREPGVATLIEGARERRIAVNVDPEEGDLTRGDPEEVARLFDRGRVVPQAALGATLDRARHGIELGWLFLGAALAALLVEAWFSNRVAMGR